MIAPHIEYRRNAVALLTSQIGVYVLCDLDNVAIYVGQSTDGIRARVQRHLTSARSPEIARAMGAHFARLTRYHQSLLDLSK